MVAFNFKAEFAPDVESGEKRQTIRKTQRCKPGDPVQLYTGQRTKQCRKLGDGVCTDAYMVVISETGVSSKNLVITSRKRRAVFAAADGFKSWAAMLGFFEKQYGLPFVGFLHKWRPE